MLLFYVSACSSDATTWVRATEIGALDEAVGGPKAMARPGDFLLENDQIRLGILDARYSLGPSPYGGTLADADVQRPDPRYAAGHGNDQLAELFATVNMNLAGADTDGQVQIVSDGSDGDEARIRVTAEGKPFLTMLSPLWAIVGQPTFTIQTDYVLTPGARAVRIETTASLDGVPTNVQSANVSDTELDVLGLAMTSGVAFGDFYLQGGSIDVFAPGIGFDEDRAVYEASLDGRNLFQEPFSFDFVGGTGDKVSYAIAPTEGQLFVPLFTSSQTAVFGGGVTGTVTDPGDTGLGDEDYDRFPGNIGYSYTRYFGVGRGDVASAMSAVYATRGDTTGALSGHVLEAGTGTPVSGAHVLVFAPGAEAPFTELRTDLGDDTQLDGSFGGELDGLLLPGDYELMVHQSGRPDSERVQVTVHAGETTDVLLSSPRTGAVEVTIVDELGRTLPAKVSFFTTDGTPVLAPAFGDHYIAGNPAEVVFLPHGEGSVVLPPGEYYAVATRGIEYELATSEDFVVGESGVAKLQLHVEHSVDTTGWISADFHVHGGNSFDSGVSLENRVITYAAEGVDFFASTDHDYLTDYRPTVEDLDLEPWVKTAVGLETTTLEIGHFLGFPLAHDTSDEQGGAFDWTGMTPTEILDELTLVGQAAGYDPMRFVAHPRDGILGYFDQYGFSTWSGDVATPLLSSANEILDAGYFTTSFDALELLNGKRFELIRTPTAPEIESYGSGGDLSNFQMVERTAAEQEALIDGVYHLTDDHQGQVDDWFTLLNTGVRATALANSDSHSRFSIEAGCPRNFVYVGEDEPALLDEQGVADAVKAGHVVASYGPFVRFTANDGEAMVGDEISDSDGTVSLHIEVEAPTWMVVDRVELYKNGTLIHEWSGLDPDVLRFAEDLDVAVDKDSWFVVIALGDGDLAPLFSPVEYPPVQLQDVVLEALSGVPAISSFLSPAVPIPREGAVLPYALTNPIYVDVDGGGWSPPGVASWMVP